MNNEYKQIHKQKRYVIFLGLLVQPNINIQPMNVHMYSYLYRKLFIFIPMLFFSSIYVYTKKKIPFKGHFHNKIKEKLSNDVFYVFFVCLM